MNSDLDIKLLVEQLRHHDSETEWIEFKTNNTNPEMIGTCLSALANSACRLGIPTAYMLWGIDDATHEVVGSAFRYRLERRGNEELENWLRHHLSENASFEFVETEIDGNPITVLVISAALFHTVDFKKTAYVRVGSYTKKLKDYPTIESEVWDRISKSDFEGAVARGGLGLDEALSLLDWMKYFELLGMAELRGSEGIVRYLCEDGMVIRQDDGRYAITNLGALLLARRLKDFPTVERKSIRLVQYEGRGRTKTLRSKEFEGGYACEFESAVELVMALTPAEERVAGAVRKQTTEYPELAVRELIANELIHQDFAVAGAGPLVEVFSDRIDFTNPGTSLVDILRLMDNPPKSRNQKLAALMRRFRFCEELGTGWDKIIASCEASYLPAPKAVEYHDAGGSMRVSLMAGTPFRLMSNNDRMMTCYWHACMCFANGDAMTNKSLRTRFGTDAPSASTISKLLSMTLDEGLIRPVDVTTAPRYMRYVPIWA